MAGEGALPNRPVMIVTDEDAPLPFGRSTNWYMPSVAGRKPDPARPQWFVWIAGPNYQIELDVSRARQLAADILGVCDVIDGCHPSEAPAAVQVLAEPYDPGSPAPGSHEGFLTRAMLMSAESGLPLHRQGDGTDDQGRAPC